MNNQVIDENLIPYEMLHTQAWFANIITTPLGENNRIQPITYEGMCVAEEASKYIIPSPTLKPHERIQIYNQQYWWRLLNALHANFPLVTRLCGTFIFNEQIGIPFLLRAAPNHWSIALVGEKLPAWIADSYNLQDKTLIHHAATLDWAFAVSDMASEAAPLNLAAVGQQDPEALLNFTYYLQPHIQLFQWDYDLLTFRNTLLKKEANYWLQHPFPKLKTAKTPFYFSLFRNKKHGISFKKISQSEYLLLSLFKKGSTLSEACEYMQNQDEKIYQETLAHLQRWLQEWAHAGWLTEHCVLEPSSETL